MLLLLSCATANASLIGDEAGCYVYAEFSGTVFADSECSTAVNTFVGGPATVDESLEFYLTSSYGGAYNIGGWVDIGDDWFEFRPTQLLAGIAGSLWFEISSLDWVGSPEGYISDILVTPTEFPMDGIRTQFDDHSVRVILEDFVLSTDSVIRVDLISSGHSHPVPLPSGFLLLLTGVGLLALRFRFIRDEV
jgi:hypothetical protein